MFQWTFFSLYTQGVEMELGAKYSNLNVERWDWEAAGASHVANISARTHSKYQISHFVANQP
jgi:hypothetical protein